MAGDKGRKSRPGDELLDWWTVSYRTLYLIAGGIVLIVCGAAYYYFIHHREEAPVAATPAPAPSSSARFTSSEGKVQVRKVGIFDWENVDRNTILNKGDLVKTSPGSSAEITFFDGTVFHIRPDSLMTIEETSENSTTKARRVAAHISSGEFLFNAPQKSAPGSGLDITTPLTHISTRENAAQGGIKVEDDGESDIRLFKGNAEVEMTKSGEKIQLDANQVVKIDRDGNSGPKLDLPGTPALLAPPHQAEISYPDPQKATTLLAWRTVPGAIAYHFQIDFSASFNRPIQDRRDWKESAVELRGLDAGKYYWRVAAIDKQNVEGSFSDFARFSIARPSGNTASRPPLDIELFDRRTNILQIKGKTEPGATVSVNGQPLDVEADGSFNEFITLEKAGHQEVVVRAVGVNGGVHEQRRSVVVAF